MASYIFRRLFSSVFVLLGASFIVFLLSAYSGDPRDDLRASNDPAKETKIRVLTDNLNLDVPAPIRYFMWLGGAARCVIPFANSCDLGVTRDGNDVTAALSTAIPATIQLLIVATILAIVIGITVGIVTALRQYSGLDYSVTFITFLFFSLPSFWVAVLLKEFGAIGFNNFLANPVIPTGVIIVTSLVGGGIWSVLIGGDLRRRTITFVAATAITLGAMIYISQTKWFATPGLGPIVMAVTGVGIALAATLLISGLRNRRALYSGLLTVGVGMIVYFAIQPLLKVSTWGTILILAVVAAGVAWAIGFFMGGYDRSQSIRIAVITALGMGGLTVIDKFMQTWPTYTSHDLIRNRPIATIGSNTPGMEGSIWLTGLDSFTHFLLPTIAIVLISLATYTRYSRASMLEVMSQDYVRTARAKGLAERTVIMRHAFRNALIPLATIVAFDIGGLVGGAVITENVFSIPGMGTMFIRGVREVDPNPIMGVFLITGIAAVLFNLLADLAYSALDPRVRVKV